MDERIRQWALGGAGVLMIAGAARIVWPERAEVPVSRGAPVARTFLYVQREGAAIRLHWNPGSPDVRAAKRGAVVIHDGKRESRLDLTANELRAGVASYRPESGEVAFRLELDGEQAGSVRASAAADERPSPFEMTERPRRKGRPIQRVEPVQAPAREKKESAFSRALGKIPLLRRLRGRERKQSGPQMDADRRR